MDYKECGTCICTLCEEVKMERQSPNQLTNYYYYSKPTLTNYN